MIPESSAEQPARVDQRTDRNGSGRTTAMFFQGRHELVRGHDGNGCKSAMGFDSTGNGSHDSMLDLT